MAQFCIEIDDNDIVETITAVAFNYKRPSQVENPDYDPEDENSEQMIDNPESPSVFANRIVREFLSNGVIAYRKKMAKLTAEGGVDLTPPAIIDPN